MKVYFLMVDFCFFFFVVYIILVFFFFFQAEDGIRDVAVTGVQTCGLPILVEQYFRGAQPTEPVNTKSVTKSVLSALTGIALAQGSLDSLNAPVTKWLAADLPDSADARVRQLTVRHLLTMTGGFKWQENGPITGEWMRSPNQVRFMLGDRMAAPPGKE